MQGRDGQSGRVGRHRGAVVAGDHVQAQVQPGRCTGRGQNLAFVDVEDVGIEVDGRKARAEVLGGDPVRSRALTVEQSGVGQGKGA
jgi:hypothetical protein